MFVFRMHSLLNKYRRYWLRTHTLVLCGDSGLGKTPLAMAMCAELAGKMRKVCPWEPYFVKVGTVEAPKEAFAASMIKMHVPIMFDDLTLEQTGAGVKGSFPVEALKLIMEAKDGSSMKARFADFVFPANSPRIFTSNALNPNDFHSALPVDPWNMTQAARIALAPNVKATFKRACFAVVTHPMVSYEVSESHAKSRRSS